MDILYSTFSVKEYRVFCSRLEFFEVIKKIVDPESIIHYGGLTLLLIILFAENGIIFGFFLPGDSLVFLSGVICAIKPELLNTNITLLTILMIIAAILGSLFGYYFGMKIGPPVFERKESFFFKKKHVKMTREFYLKHGGKTLILGRFLPIIRTFAPILAGVIRVNFGTFMFFNVVGGIMWVTSLSLIGYFLGSRFPQIEEYLGYIILTFIVSTSLILLNTYVIQKRRKKKEKENNESL